MAALPEVKGGKLQHPSIHMCEEEKEEGKREREDEEEDGGGGGEEGLENNKLIKVLQISQ